MNRPGADLKQPTEPVFKMPGMGDTAVLDVMEFVDRHMERLAAWGDAKPFAEMSPADFGANCRAPRGAYLSLAAGDERRFVAPENPAER